MIAVLNVPDTWDTTEGMVHVVMSVDDSGTFYRDISKDDGPFIIIQHMVAFFGRTMSQVMTRDGETAWVGARSMVPVTGGQ